MFIERPQHLEQKEAPKESKEDKLQQETAELYAELIERPEVAEALELLDHLPEDLRYHVKDHTLDVTV